MTKDETREYMKKWRIDHADKKVKRRRKQYHIDNADEEKWRHKQWRIDNPEKVRQYKNNRMKTDIQYRISYRLRIRLHDALDGNYKVGSAVRDLGCSVADLKKHLESKFDPGMTWDNYGRDGWHIDHIIPLAKFNLQEPSAIFDCQQLHQPATNVGKG